MSARPAPAGRPHPTVAAVRDLLRRPGFRHLFTARIVSQFGDGLFQLAAADLLLFDKPGANPAWTLTKLSAVTLIPFSMVVPLVGVFIDRWDRRRILTFTPLLRAALMGIVPLVASGNADNLGFYLIVLVVLSANRFFLATMSAVTPQLVPADELLVANSIATTGGSIANVVGLGAGAALSSFWTGTGASAVAAVAFAGAAILGRAIPVHRGERLVHVPLRAAVARVVSGMVAGVRKVRSSAVASYALGAITSMQVLIGAVTATIAVVYIKRLHLGVGAVTGVLAVTAVGIFAGVVAVPVAARHIREERLPVVGFVLGGLATLGTAVALSRSSIVAGSIFAGVSFAFAKIPVDTMVQESLPDEFRGRAFASYDLLYNVARVVGTAAAAAAVAAGASEKSIVAVIGAAYLLAAVVTYRRSGGVREKRAPEPARPEPEPPRPKRLPAPAPFSPGEMIGVRAYAGSRADEEPRAIVVGEREFPIDDVIWRAVEERGGVRRRIFVARVAGHRVRLAYDEVSSLWEIDRILADPFAAEHGDRSGE